MRVLLTGAAGFIGARIAAALRDAGHDVVAVDVMLPAAHGGHAEPPPDCQVVDIRDASTLAPLLNGIDVVCHLAGSDPLEDVPVDHDLVTTSRLLDAMGRAGTPDGTYIGMVRKNVDTIVGALK